MTDAINTEALLRKLHEATAVKGGAAQLARDGGVTEGLVSQIVNGKQKIGPKVARALGYQRKVLWTPLQADEGVQ